MILSGAMTDFSVGKSILKSGDLALKAFELGYSAIAVADDYTVNALPKLTDAAKKHGIKLVIGATIRIVDSLEDDLKGKFFEPKLYAKNAEGMRQINLLLTLANSADHALPKRNLIVPRITLDELIAGIHGGNVVLATGSMFGLFSHRRWVTILNTLENVLPPKCLVIELVPVETLYYRRLTALAIEAKALHAPNALVVISRPTLHFENMNVDRIVHDCLINHAKMDSTWRNTPSRDLHPMSARDLVMELKRTLDHLVEHGMIEKAWRSVGVDALEGTRSFADHFDYVFEALPISLPNMAENPFAELTRQTIIGWKKRIEESVLGYTPTADLLPKYKERLRYELTTLKTMGFENYFLLVSLVVTWCKENDIMVGPGRGSAGGSLVAFLMGITDVDPIRFNLIFERFINPDRLDLPDIDLDFMSSRRGEVIQFLENKFGKEYVAGISNYVELGSSQCIRSVGSAFGLIEPDFSCSKQVPKESGQPIGLLESAELVPDIKRFSEAHPKVWKSAVNLQGTFKSYGQHAAGVIVAGEPIAGRAVIIDNKESRVVNWDKDSCEKFGLVKLDVLGLTTLDLLHHAKAYVVEATGADIDYLKIPLNDKAVLRAFGEGKTTGVFQFESGASKHLLKEAAVGGELTFEDVYAITALNRPGPLQSGLTEQWVGIKQGALFPDYAHPSMVAALEETQSVIVYQEQVMQIARDLAGFTMAESDHLRKAMGKKNLEAIQKMREQWIVGCGKHSEMGEERAGLLFDQIEKFAGYGFNKSHSVEYTVLSYWSMYMKINHPAAFYAAALTTLGEDKRMEIIKDAKKQSVTVLPPCINRSTLRFEIDWTAESPTLLAPLQMVKGLSEKGVASIFEAREKVGRPFASKQEFVDNVYKRAVNTRVQASLDAIGAFAAIEEGPGALDPCRLKDQKVLLPGLMVEDVKADRVMAIDETIMREIASVVGEWQKAGEGIGFDKHPLPKMGVTPKIMLISDCPNYTELQEGKMGMGEASAELYKVMKELGINEKMVYHTSLCKTGKPKGGEITPEMIKVYGPFLRQEIAILQPPVVVCLGSKSIRFMSPDVKGSWDQLCGQAHYHPDIDATVVFGMNPAMCHFDSTKVKNLREAMMKVKELI